MATLTIRLDALGLDDAIQSLGAKEVRARVRALNRTIGTAQTEARRAIAADTGLPQRVVAESLSVERAVFGRPTATLRASGRRIPLYDFTRQRKLRGRPTGRGAVPGAFIAQMRSGHVGIFKRVGLSRSRKGLPRHAPGLPITELFGPSLPFVFTNETIMAALIAHAKDNLAKNYRHEVQFLERARAS